MMAVTTRKKINVLRNAIAVLKENKWNRTHSAEDVNGCIVLPTSSHAASFCAIGAVLRVTASQTKKSKEEHITIIREVNASVCEATGISELSEFNDFVARDKRHVIRVLEKTVKYLEAQ